MQPSALDLIDDEDAAASQVAAAAPSNEAPTLENLPEPAGAALAAETAKMEATFDKLKTARVEDGTEFALDETPPAAERSPAAGVGEKEPQPARGAPPEPAAANGAPPEPAAANGVPPEPPAARGAPAEPPAAQVSELPEPIAAALARATESAEAAFRRAREEADALLAAELEALDEEDRRESIAERQRKLDKPPAPPLEGFDLDALGPLLEKSLGELRAAGLDWGAAEVDHVCWRCATPKEYEYAGCRALRARAAMLGEALVGGRPVSVFELREPLAVAGYKVRLLEIPAPKPGRDYATGWEHAEIALGEGLDAFAAGLREDARGLEVDWRAWTKAVNRDVSVAAPGSSFRVKFHAKPLDAVLRDERADGSYDQVPENYWDPLKDAADANAAACLAALESALREHSKPYLPTESPLAAAMMSGRKPELDDDADAPPSARYDEAARRLLEPAAPFPKDEWEQLMADAAATPEFDDMLNRARVDGLNLRRRLAEDVEPVDPELRRIVEERNAAREEGRLLLDPI